MSELNHDTIAENIVEVLRNNPERWGSSDWNLAIDVDDGSVSIDHNTTCYNECCANRNAVLISMYDFDTDGWFDVTCDDDDNEEYKIIGTTEEWLGSEMFAKHQIAEWLENND